LDLKGKIQHGFFQEIYELRIGKSIPKAAARDVFSGKVDIVPMRIGDGFFLGGDRKGGN
jgi:hypothetical protein